MSEPTTCVDAEPYALRILDDSMEPEFENGCIVVIDPTGHARDGAYVLAEHGDGLLIRQLRFEAQGLSLVALNPDYPQVRIGRRLSLVKGVIVQRAGRRRHYHKRYD